MVNGGRLAFRAHSGFNTMYGATSLLYLVQAVGHNIMDLNTIGDLYDSILGSERKLLPLRAVWYDLSMTLQLTLTSCSKRNESIP